jgi:hypothetical protein
MVDLYVVAAAGDDDVLCVRHKPRESVLRLVPRMVVGVTEVRWNEGGQLALRDQGRSIPLSPPMQVDVGEAFGFVFRSRNWFGRLAVGGFCLLCFCLLFIPLFILLGYSVETARTISHSERELTPWTDVGTKPKVRPRTVAADLSPWPRARRLLFVPEAEGTNPEM